MYFSQDHARGVKLWEEGGCRVRAAAGPGGPDQCSPNPFPKAVVQQFCFACSPVTPKPLDKHSKTLPQPRNSAPLLWYSYLKQGVFLSWQREVYIERLAHTQPLDISTPPNSLQNDRSLWPALREWRCNAVATDPSQPLMSGWGCGVLELRFRV